MADQGYTTLILVGTDPDHSPELYDAITAAGFVFARLHTSSPGPELPLECFVDLRQEVLERLHARGITTLSDFTWLSFKDAWQLLLATPDDDAFTFRELCRLFATLKLKFSDLDPAQLKCRSSEQWQARGLDGRTAGVLVRLGIIGEQMLMAFTPYEIRSMYNIGSGIRYHQVMALRQQLT